MKEVYIPSTNNRNQLHVAIWEPERETKAILQISHGMVEYIVRYDDFAKHLNQQGILVIGNDHTAGHIRSVIAQHLRDRGYEVEEIGSFSTESSNYPEWGEKTAMKVVSGEADLGIAICGTGVGISIACNKHKGIRACCCSEATSARLTREHNDANIICFGARIVSTELANDIVDTFLTTPFSNGERHKRRIAQIHEIEE